MNSRSQNGVSMLEIVGVIIILGLLTAVARVPMNHFLKTIDQKNAVVGVRKLLQTARSKAMANPGLHCGVWFDNASVPPRAVMFLDTYLPGDYAYDAGKDKNYLAPFILPRDSRLVVPTPYPAAVVFRGDGSAYISGRVFVTAPDFIDTLDVLAATGRIRSSR